MLGNQLKSFYWQKNKTESRWRFDQTTNARQRDSQKKMYHEKDVRSDWMPRNFDPTKINENYWLSDVITGL